MSRRHRAEKREVHPDPRFNSVPLARFVNVVMLDGKRSVAEKVVYGALETAQSKLKQDPLEIFNTAMDNVKPSLEVRSRRVGGATYQVPSEVSPARQQALAMRWIVGAARGRKGRAMAAKLADEIVDAFNNRGSAVKKREDVHKMAEANRAFSHFKW